MIKAIIESPYAGEGDDLVRNILYARFAMKYALDRGFAPFASHLLYTQPGILDDKVRTDRLLGCAAGFEWGGHAQRVMVFYDLGITEGMRYGIEAHTSRGIKVTFHSIDGWAKYWNDKTRAEQEELINVHRSWF